MTDETREIENQSYRDRMSFFRGHLTGNVTANLRVNRIELYADRWRKNSARGATVSANAVFISVDLLSYNAA